jgi:MoxR-like ATPase
MGAMDKTLQTILDSVGTIILGKERQIRLAVTCLLARGHLLIEDLPGVGKTTLAHGLAHTLGLDYQRIQFTSDLLPADILGVSIYDRAAGGFQFHPGPVFAQLILADEINRATPKTQSALLEAMEEGQITVEGETRPLPDPFFVIATQNPTFQIGTFPLPESQLDRFLMRLSMGYPGRDEELELLRSRGAEPELEQLRPVLDGREVIEMQNLVPEVHVSEDLLRYLLAVVELTRDHEALALGVSTRGCLAWQRSAQALALVRGRSFVIPDDLQDTAEQVLAHRVLHADPLVGDGWQRSRAERAVIRAVLETIPVPR